jgi:hypothetical protein
MLRKVVVCAALSGALFMCGCAGVRAPIKTEAALGKVVVYRNGVAYFERRAVVTDGELRLNVPVDRVDDFLKSLKVVDAKTGESLPVSFKTVESGTDETEMVVALPSKQPREIKVSYVTDSPSWKPSYRVVLGKKPGRAELEAWAVVDNVSGEDWKRVQIGVGSTSALSFRFDLHSVRLVERESLGDEAAAALAPPTGGSPYAVAAKEKPVVGEIGNYVVDRLVKNDDAKVETSGGEVIYNAASGAAASRIVSAHKSARKASAEQAAGQHASRLSGFDGRTAYGGGGGGKASAANAPTPVVSTPDPDAALDRLAEQVKKQAGKVMLQGFARNKDSDKNAAALRRANAVRDGLIARGVSPDQVEAVSANAVSESQAVRIVADNQSEKPRQAQRTAEESKDPVGSAYFMAGAAMTIEKDRSAMVSLLKSDTKADRVYYYDPISSRGSREFAFQAVRIENPSNYTLDRGPITVYDEGQFLGEGLSEAIPPKSAAFIPYALDRQLVVEPASEDRDEIRRLVTIQRGIITAEVEHIRKTTFSLHNRSDKEATVYVRHAVVQGWELRPTTLPMERLSGNYLFQVRVPARGAMKVDLEEAQPLEQAIDIRTRAGATSVGLYLKHPGNLDPKLRAALDEILVLYKEMADAEQKIATLGEQMNEYRKRVDELNVELVTLRRVKAAQDLSRHLAKKMQEVSDRLQKATIRATDLQEELMTRRIRVEDKLAELTLTKEPPAEKVAGK